MGIIKAMGGAVGGGLMHSLKDSWERLKFGGTIPPETAGGVH